MKTSLYNKILAFGFAILFGFSTDAVGQDNTTIKYDKTGNIKYIKFDGGSKTGEWVSPKSPEVFFTEFLGVKGSNELVLQYKLTREDGSFHEI